MIAGWEGFFEAEVGASAALAGLIFVGLSINITRIVSTPKLPGRAIQALAVLVAILVISLLLLVPGQSVAVLGAEVLVVGSIVWVANLRIDLSNYSMTDAKYRASYVLVVLLDQTATLLYVASGASIVAFGAAGIYLLVPATIASFLEATIDAWVLLVEINR